MAELDLTCPDCGTTYQCTPEQAGKLLHCKCGRYLVAGGENLKSVSEEDEAPEAPAKPAAPASAPPPSPTIGVKPPAIAIPPPETVTINVKTPTHTAPPPPPEPPEEIPPAKHAARPSVPAGMDQRTMMMIGGGVGVLVVLVAGFLLMRPGSKPETGTPSPSPSTTAGTSPAAGGCAGTPTRLDNGTVVAHSLLGNGYGRLQIDNQTASDVSVRLISEGDLTVTWIYVQQGQTAEVTNIPLGNHRLRYSTGSDWDAQSLTFRCNDAYSQFEKPLDYNERREDDRTVYSNRKVTLGKAKAENITKEEFLKGHIGRPT